MTEFGQDDGILCDQCNGKTWLIQDQGYGLCSYHCDNCDYDFLVQYDNYDEDFENEEFLYDYDGYDPSEG